MPRSISIIACGKLGSSLLLTATLVRRPSGAAGLPICVRGSLSVPAMAIAAPDDALLSAMLIKQFRDRQINLGADVVRLSSSPRGTIAGCHPQTRERARSRIARGRTPHYGRAGPTRCWKIRAFLLQPSLGLRWPYTPLSSLLMQPRISACRVISHGSTKRQWNRCRKAGSRLPTWSCATLPHPRA